MLKIKAEFPLPFTLTKNIVGLGNISFDSKSVDPKDYHKWAALGFADIFEEEAPVQEKKKRKSNEDKADAGK